MKMNEKWRTYWTSDTMNKINDLSIMSIEKNTTLIYINTILMKASSKNVQKSWITFINDILTSQDK